MYHASLGRFLQRDPIGYVDGMGLYEYVQSKPLDLMDANGLSASEKIARWTRFAREISLVVVRAVAWEIHGVVTGRRCCPGERKNVEFRAESFVCIAASAALPVIRAPYICHDYGKFSWQECDLRGYWRRKESIKLFMNLVVVEMMFPSRAPIIFRGKGSFTAYVARWRMEQQERLGPTPGYGRG